MTGHLSIIWDFDGAIGHVNATYPYRFNEQKLIEEIDNVEIILQLGKTHNIKMTFACVGFGAEPGIYPYHIPNLIKKIYDSGHEIASHSWRHEWFPYLEREQIRLSLSRSKYALEKCIDAKDAVTGFIPPFNRPMSWYGKGALSIGDRALGPWFPGSDLGSLLKFVNKAGYQWARTTYRPLIRKFFKQKDVSRKLNSKWTTYQDVYCVPNHYVGFDKPAQDDLEYISKNGGDLVISGHPSALSFGREESIKHLESFLRLVDHHQQNNTVKSLCVQELMMEKENEQIR